MSTPDVWRERMHTAECAANALRRSFESLRQQFAALTDMHSRCAAEIAELQRERTRLLRELRIKDEYMEALSARLCQHRHAEPVSTRS